MKAKIKMTDRSQRKRIVSYYDIPFQSSILLSALYAFVLSFVIMGTAFVHLFACLFVISTTVMLSTYALARPMNWFEFDDEKKIIKKVFQKRIPYDKIRSIIIVETSGRFTINVRMGWLPPSPLVRNLSTHDAELASKEFEQRFPSDMIRKESHSNKRTMVFIALVSLVVVIALAGLLSSVNRSERLKVVTVEKTEWSAAHLLQKGTPYQMNGFSFFLPKRFAQVKQDAAWLYFEDGISRTKINVGAGLSQDANFRHGSVIGFLTGIQSDYDLFHIASTARYGLIPVFANSIVFRELTEIKLTEFSRGSLRGIVLRGVKERDPVAEIIVADQERGVHFLVTQFGEKKKIKEDLLQAIAAGIRSGRKEGE